MKVFRTISGKVNGSDVEKITFKNDNGQILEVTNFGATIHSWKLDIGKGQYKDILLGKDRIDEYLLEHPNFGCIVGRYANRIKNGEFTLNGKLYQVSKNLNGHHLHGGFDGFGKKIWKIEHLENNDSEGILELSYVSYDGEEGFPGTLKVNLTITFNQKNELTILHHAYSDKDTICNLTNHCYFNLGSSASILNHSLQIKALQCTETNAELIPTGHFLNVEGSPFDFIKKRKVDWSDFLVHPMIQYGKGYDVNYVLEKRNNYQSEAAAKLFDEDNLILLEVFTSKPGLQLYTGNWLNGIAGKGQKTYNDYNGICLEPQYFPDSPNNAHFPSSVLKEGEPYFHYLKYKVSQKIKEENK